MAPKISTDLVFRDMESIWRLTWKIPKPAVTFSDLPFELRVEIWRLALPGPRLLVTIKPGKGKPQGGEVEGRRGSPASYGTPLAENRKPPVLLAVCSESREVALKEYSLCFVERSKETGVFINQKIDTVELIPRWHEQSSFLDECSVPSKLRVLDMIKKSYTPSSLTGVGRLRIPGEIPHEPFGMEDASYRENFVALVRRISPTTTYLDALIIFNKSISPFAYHLSECDINRKDSEIRLEEPAVDELRGDKMRKFKRIHIKTLYRYTYVLGVSSEYAYFQRYGRRPSELD